MLASHPSIGNPRVGVVGGVGGLQGGGVREGLGRVLDGTPPRPSYPTLLGPSIPHTSGVECRVGTVNSGGLKGPEE